MVRRRAEEEEWDNAEDEWQSGDAESSSDDDEESTVPCPYCKRQIHEDSERCPYCEHYISEEDVPSSRKRWWIVVGALLCLYVVYRWIVG
jgi:uncharacterized paraquat-inducible protein A